MVHAALQVRSFHHFLIPGHERLIAKRHGDLFQRMPGCLDIVEVRETRGEEAEAGDDDVEVAADSGEGVGRDHADYEVEDPVGCLGSFRVG